MDNNIVKTEDLQNGSVKNKPMGSVSGGGGGGGGSEGTTPIAPPITPVVPKTDEINATP